MPQIPSGCAGAATQVRQRAADNQISDGCIKRWCMPVADLETRPMSDVIALQFDDAVLMQHLPGMD